MKTIIKSPQYEHDITAIWDQIAQHNAEAAERVLMAIEDRIDLLGSFPRLGTPCPHLAPGAAPDAVEKLPDLLPAAE